MLREEINVRISTVLVAQNLIERGYPFVESIYSVEPFSWEIIIVEGYSTDDTMEWLQKLQERIPKIKIIRAQFEKNSHWLANMRNVGIDACKGDYIWGGDIDEVLPEGAEKLIFKAIERFPERKAFLFPHLHFIYDFNTIRANPGYIFGHHLFKNDGNVRSISEGFWKGSPYEIVLKAPIIFHYGYVFSNATQKKLENHKKLYPHWNMETVYGNLVKTIPYRGPHPLRIQRLIARLNGKDYEPVLEDPAYGEAA